MLGLPNNSKVIFHNNEQHRSIFQESSEKEGHYSVRFESNSLKFEPDSQKDKVIKVHIDGHYGFDNYKVIRVKKNGGMLGAIPPNVEFVLVEEGFESKNTTDNGIINNINVSGPANIQNGNYNSQYNSSIDISDLFQKINDSDFSESEKNEAKSTISKMLEHPIISSMIGSTFLAGITHLLK